MELLDLSSLFTTKAEATDFLLRLSRVSEQVYHTNFDLEQTLKNEFGIRKSEAFLRLLREQKVESENRSQVKAFLEKIQQTVTSLPVVSLTLAFEPTEKTLQLLSQWFLTNTKQQYVFELSVDVKLIGGCAISVSGKYRDESIKQVFETVVTSVLEKKSQKKSQETPVASPTHQAIEHIHLGR